MENQNQKSGQLIFHVFDGKNFREWKETIMLFLMGLGLWNLVQGFEPVGKTRTDTLEVEEKKQKAYAILSLNLSSSCRDCLRDLTRPDPCLAWKSILKKFESKRPLDKLMALDELLSFALDEKDIPASLSMFKMIISHVKSLEIELDEHLFIALLLRRLPKNFNPLATNLRHRETIDLDLAIEAIESEARAINDPNIGAPTNSDALVTTTEKFCTHCKREGHNKSGCWKLHPNLVPLCNSCGKKGHWTEGCRRVTSGNNRNAEANIATLLYDDAFQL